MCAGLRGSRVRVDGDPDSAACRNPRGKVPVTLGGRRADDAAARGVLSVCRGGAATVGVAFRPK